MKPYPIVLTIVAILAIVVAGYFYWQGGAMRNQIKIFQEEKVRLETQLTGKEAEIAEKENQITEMKAGIKDIEETTEVLKAVLESFLVAGDTRVYTIGSQEAAEVEKEISEITDKTDRMGTEREWEEFKTSRRVSALVALLKGLANNLERNLERLPK